MGRYGFIGKGCTIYPNVVVGDYLLMAPGVKIIGEDHIYNIVGKPIWYSGRPPMPKTVIGSDVWIGQGATIMAGVSIGSGAVVGAGSIVTKDIEPFSIVVGCPARHIRYRFDSESDRIRHLKSIAGYEGSTYILAGLGREHG